MDSQRQQTKREHLPQIQASLGHRIRALRKKEGISQEELADRAGLHWSYLARLERGELNPTLRNLVAVATGLRVALQEIFRFGEGEAQKTAKRRTARPGR